MLIARLDENLWGTSRIVFEVPLPNSDPVYMSMYLSEFMFENFGIVIVDAQRFLRLWQADPRGRQRNLAYGNPVTWPTDTKYRSVADVFAEGRENPVPLACVGFSSEETEYVTFTDGITRTIWLLTHGCAAIPVRCRASRARELFMAAAADGTSFHTLREWAELTTA
jgi:hypothetical protein